MQTNTTKRRVKRKDNPVPYEVKRAYDERDKRQERISRWEAGHVSSGADAAAKLIALAKEKTADASPELAEKAQA